MPEKWQECYDHIEAMICALMFGECPPATESQRQLVQAWMIQHELGPNAVRERFEPSRKAKQMEQSEAPGD
jgi:hypothetical protein